VFWIKCQASFLSAPVESYTAALSNLRLQPLDG
jgi:hypothetical protein